MASGSGRMMRVTAVVIGAGHAGLAASHELTARSIDHVVLERGEVANAWRTQRWDSLRLLTPNWLSRLPGQPYDRPGPRRLHDDGRGRRLHRAFRRGRAGSGPDPDHGDVGAPYRRRLPDHDQRRRDRLSHGPPGQRRLQPADGAGAQRSGPGLGDPAHPVRLPRAGSPPRRRGPRGRGLGDRRTAGRRAGPFGPAGDPLGGRARADAAHLPRPRRALVDGPDGRLGRAVRPGR